MLSSEIQAVHVSCVSAHKLQVCVQYVNQIKACTGETRFFRTCSVGGKAVLEGRVSGNVTLREHADSVHPWCLTLMNAVPVQTSALAVVQSI